MDRPELRPLEPRDAPACDAIVLGLPHHFGDPGGRAACARAVRSERGLVAADGDDVVGFLTLGRHYAASAEITWMAVRADRRRRGVGRRLVERAAAESLAEGVELLCVLTLGESVQERATEDNYADTRAFYRALGFVPLRELELRTWSSAALMLVRPLRAR